MWWLLDGRFFKNVENWHRHRERRLPPGVRLAPFLLTRTPRRGLPMGTLCGLLPERVLSQPERPFRFSASRVGLRGRGTRRPPCTRVFLTRPQVAARGGGVRRDGGFGFLPSALGRERFATPAPPSDQPAGRGVSAHAEGS